MARRSLGIRKLRFQYGEYVIEEFEGSSLWAAGDPITKDKETLVMFLHRRNHHVPSQTFSSKSQDQQHHQP